MGFVNNRFKSPLSTRKNSRYSPVKVGDISRASPVKPDDLNNMTITEPPVKMKTALHAPRPASKKPKQKPMTGQNDKTPRSKDPKLLKELLSPTFIIQTLGCLSRCLWRAINLFAEDVAKVVARIELAVHVLSRARGLVFQALEYFIYRTLSASDQTATQITEIMRPRRLIHQTRFPKRHCDGSGRHHFAQFASPTLIRNMISLFLDGSDSTGGRRAEKDTSKRAQDLARDIYDDFVKLIPDWAPSVMDYLCLFRKKVWLPQSIRQSELISPIAYCHEVQGMDELCRRMIHDGIYLGGS